MLTLFARLRVHFSTRRLMGGLTLLVSLAVFASGPQCACDLSSILSRKSPLERTPSNKEGHCAGGVQGPTNSPGPQRAPHDSGCPDCLSMCAQAGKIEGLRYTIQNPNPTASFAALWISDRVERVLELRHAKTDLSPPHFLPKIFTLNCTFLI